MPPTAAVQILLDGTEEASVQPGEMSFREFMDVNREEGGFLTTVQAAIILDVTRQRVVQLIEAGQLKTWEFLGKRYVSAREVAARRAADVKSGRPARSTAEKVKTAANIVARNDWRQWAAEIVNV
jgi:hypothetical protein